MRKCRVGLSFITLVLLMSMIFIGCEGPAGPAGKGYVAPGANRSPVIDGVYTTTGQGYGPSVPITVETTLINNAIIKARVISSNEKNGIIGSVENLMIPRIIQTQSLGVDNISGATFASLGVKEAIENAINVAGGKSYEWYEEVRKTNKTIRLPDDGLDTYDVIVVGLGSAGTSAYTRAAYLGATVFGVEAAGRIGGSSVTASGPFGIPANDPLIPAVKANWLIRTAPAGVSEYDQTVDVNIHRGKVKEAILDKFLAEANNTLDWHTEVGYIRFGSGMGQSATNGMRGFDVDMANSTVGQENMFNYAMNASRDRNPRNRYMLELRATELIMLNGEVQGVKATHKPTGTTYEIYGKSVILSSGGFLGDRELQRKYYGGTVYDAYSGLQLGDGIRMGIAAGAGTYNIETAPAQHLTNLRNIERSKAIIHPVTGVDLSTVIVPRVAGGGGGMPGMGGGGDNDAITTVTEDLRWKATLENLLIRYGNLYIGLENTIYDQYDTWTGVAARTGGAAGRRISDETQTGLADEAIAITSWRGGGNYAAIFSDNVLAKIATSNVRLGSGGGGHTSYNIVPVEAPITTTKLNYILTAGEEMGNVIRGSNLADLVSKLNAEGFTDVTVATLTQTINDFNKYATGAEIDPLGRTNFTQENTAAAAADALANGDPGVEFDLNGGYTAILGGSYGYGSCGGLDVNVNLQVLKASGTSATVQNNVIPGLYACGYDSLGVLHCYQGGYTLIGGTALGWGFTSGKLAAEHIVNSYLPSIK